MARKDKALKFDYDRKRDVLYAYLGRSKPAISEETPNGVLIRRDMRTAEIVGFTIVNYARKFDRGQLREIPHFPNVQLPDPR